MNLNNLSPVWLIILRQFLIIILICLFILDPSYRAQHNSAFTIGRLKYKGGGDWYANPSSIPNLLDFINKTTNINTAGGDVVVSLDDNSIFTQPITYITGHGRISFDRNDRKKLKDYLFGGGFLFIDDNYGLDKYIRKEFKKVFPKKKLHKLPNSHKIFKKPFNFPDGLPKIHEHHGGPPGAYAIYHNGRMIVFYSYNTDLGDGWEDFEVHKDPQEKREAALKMGVNIILFALSQSS